MTCTAIKADGEQCRAHAKGDTGICRWHSRDPADRALHYMQSLKGGYAKNYGSTPANLGASLEGADVDALDPNTPEGVRGIVAAALRALTKLPFDVRVANSISQLATTQRGIIETSDLAREVAEIKAALATQANS